MDSWPTVNHYDQIPGAKKLIKGKACISGSRFESLWACKGHSIPKWDSMAVGPGSLMITRKQKKTSEK